MDIIIELANRTIIIHTDVSARSLTLSTNITNDISGLNVTIVNIA